MAEGEGKSGHGAHDPIGTWRFTAALHRGGDALRLLIAGIAAAAGVLTLMYFDTSLAPMPDAAVIAAGVVLAGMWLALFFDWRWFRPFDTKNARPDQWCLGLAAIMGVVVLVVPAFSPLPPAHVMFLALMAIALVLFVEFNLSRQLRANKFHVTVVLTQDDRGVTGRILWATRWKASARVRANPRDATSAEVYPLDAAQAAAMAHVLLRLEHMLHATAGRLRIQGKKPEWTFVCVRDWVGVTIGLAVAAVALLLAIVFAIDLSAGLLSDDAATSDYLSVGGPLALALIALLMPIPALYRWRLSRNLYVRVTIQPSNVARLGWIETFLLFPRYSFRHETAPVGFAQGVEKFCDLIEDMQGTLKRKYLFGLDWGNLEIELDRPDGHGHAAHSSSTASAAPLWTPSDFTATAAAEWDATADAPVNEPAASDDRRAELETVARG